MGSKAVSLPEDAIVYMLKTLPEDALVDIFWRTFIKVDTSPLTSDERTDLDTAMREFKQGETVKWENLK